MTGILMSVRTIGGDAVEDRQGLLAVLCGEYLVADIHEGDAQNFPDALLIIDQQDFLFHVYPF
jgi:hypothetical protein